MKLFFKTLILFYGAPLAKPTSAAEVKVAHSHFANAVWRLLLVATLVSSLFNESVRATVESNPPRALNAPSCEEVLNHLEDSSQTDATVDTFGSTPNEVELEIFGRITHAYQKGWLKEARDLDGMIKSPTPILPPLNWNDLEISAHKARWDELLTDQSLRWQMVQKRLRNLQDEISARSDQETNSKKKTEAVETPLFLGAIWPHLEFKKKVLAPGEIAGVYALENEDRLLIIESNRRSVFVDANRFWERLLQFQSPTPFLSLGDGFKLPDGSYISSTDDPTKLPTDASPLAVQSAKALKRYRVETIQYDGDTKAIFVGGLASTKDTDYLAIYAWHKTALGAENYEYAFLPLASDKPILSTFEIERKAPGQRSSENIFPVELDLDSYFETIDIKGQIYGIWKTKKGFWIFDFMTKKPILLIKNKNQTPTHLISTPTTGFITSIEIVKTDSSTFVFVSTGSQILVYDLNKLPGAKSDSDLLVANWNLVESANARITSNKNRGYALGDKSIRKFDLSAQQILHTEWSDLELISQLSEVRVANSQIHAFEHRGHEYIFVRNRDNKLFLVNVTKKTMTSSVLGSIDHGLRSCPFLGFIHLDNAVLATFSDTWGDIYLVQLIGPENATVEDYEDSLPKFEGAP